MLLSQPWACQRLQHQTMQLLKVSAAAGHADLNSSHSLWWWSRRHTCTPAAVLIKTISALPQLWQLTVAVLAADAKHHYEASSSTAHDPRGQIRWGTAQQPAGGTAQQPAGSKQGSQWPADQKLGQGSTCVWEGGGTVIIATSQQHKHRHTTPLHALCCAAPPDQPIDAWSSPESCSSLILCFLCCSLLSPAAVFPCR